MFLSLPCARNSPDFVLNKEPGNVLFIWHLTEEFRESEINYTPAEEEDAEL